MQQIQIVLQPDFLQRLVTTRPVQALVELIWNSLDAEAKDVRVVFDRDRAERLVGVRVVDDGHGMPFDRAPDFFKNLGGSWKRQQRRSAKEKRSLHGEQGKGRLRALALGRVAEWRITIPETESSHKLARYSITIVRDRLHQAEISDLTPAPPGARVGCEVVISELAQQWQMEGDEKTRNELTEVLAPYLMNYSQARVAVGGILLEPEDQIRDRQEYPLSPIAVEGNPPAWLKVIEWKTEMERALFLCTEEGFPVLRLAANVTAPAFSFAAYLLSPYISNLHRDGSAEMAQMLPEVNAAADEAREVLKQHFKARATERVHDLVADWKSEDVYPYEREPVSAVEKLEREVFDVVATSVATALPDIQVIEKKTRKFQLRMLRQAIERGPEELQLILTQVLDLPQKKQQELAKLLRRTSLIKVISAAKMIADRLEFLEALSAMLFDSELKKNFKERKHLHRLLEKHTWIFGEEFHLTVSDRDLTEVLRKCRAEGGLENALIDDDPVVRPAGGMDSRKRGIVDLVLSRRLPPSRGERHHLVIELKAPKKRLSAKDTAQVKSYAYAVSDDERFRGVGATWDFWLVSNDMEEFVRSELKNSEGNGVLQRMPDPRVTIRVKTWGQLIDEARDRMQFIQRDLDYEVNRDESLAEMRATYAAILGSTPLTEVDPPDVYEPDDEESDSE
jgi:hypothetical protein